MPEEYLSLVLCRDVYHCTPVALRQVPLPDILSTLTCLDIEAQVRDARRK